MRCFLNNPVLISYALSTEMIWLRVKAQSSRVKSHYLRKAIKLQIEVAVQLTFDP
jgi:hypothetical protein